MKQCVLNISYRLAGAYRLVNNTFLVCLSQRYGRNCSLEFVFSMLLCRREGSLGLLVGIYPMDLMNQTCESVSNSCR